MIQEVIWTLKLIEININVLPIFNVLSDLMFPFEALHIIHELFTVAVVEKYSDFCLLVVLEIKPQLLDFNCLIVHIFSEFLQ
jgi:hypothetical protein